MSGPVSRAWGRLQKPLRTSKAPNFRALVRAAARGPQLVSLTSAVQATYLHLARGRWLDLWADAFAMARRSGERDSALRDRIVSTSLTRGDTRLKPVEDQIKQDVGQEVIGRNTLPYVAFYDNLESMIEGGNFMADFQQITGIIVDKVDGWGEGAWGTSTWGPEPEPDQYVYDDTPFHHLGYRGRTPIRPGWGPKGVVFAVAQEYDANLELAVINSAESNLPAATGFDLFWSHTFTNELEDTIHFKDGGFTTNDSGWGIDEWGTSTWG